MPFDAASADAAAASPRTRATLTGSAAVLMWAGLAPLTAAAGAIAPLQLLVGSFAVAFTGGLAWLALSGGRPALGRLRQPWRYYLFATAALFSYHALYFTALALAPPAEASLIAYLWPLLIVLFSALGPDGQRLRPAHLAGALLGLSGTALLVLSSATTAGTVHPKRLAGLAAAGACALIWSGYSVLNRRFRRVPSEAMIGVCGAVALLGALACVPFPPAVAAPGLPHLLALVALGLGPVGLAFLTWDYGTKHGNLAVLGTISYAAPVLSTLLLVIFGRAQASLTLLTACTLVVGGAWVATRTPGGA